jgi:hypothetical protein
MSQAHPIQSGNVPSSMSNLIHSRKHYCSFDVCVEIEHSPLFRGLSMTLLSSEVASTSIPSAKNSMDAVTVHAGLTLHASFYVKHFMYVFMIGI